MDNISFPNIGVYLKNIGNAISIGSFDIKFYGVIIALGFVAAYFLVTNEAKRTNQNPENYLDFILWMVLPVIVGARAYFVLFKWKDYVVKGNLKETLLGMLNIRNGGLAIYGGIIAGIIVGIIFTRKRKMSFLLTADTAAFGLLIGQIMGRFGNFFNREAFGSYSDSKLAMALPIDFFKNEGSFFGMIQSGEISQKMLDNTRVIKGMECIMVHPTFLYESLWNLMLLIFLLIYRKHKKFVGEFAFIYVAGYGIGRFFIEGLRSDSLMIADKFKVSQCLGLACFIFGTVLLVLNYIKYFKNKKQDKTEASA